MLVYKDDNLTAALNIIIIHDAFLWLLTKNWRHVICHIKGSYTLNLVSLHYFSCSQLESQFTYPKTTRTSRVSFHHFEPINISILFSNSTSWPVYLLTQTYNQIYIYEFPSSKSKNEVSGFNWRGHLGKAHYRTNYHQQLTIQMKPYPLNRTTTNVILNVQVKLRLLLWFGRLSKTHLHLQQEC